MECQLWAPVPGQPQGDSCLLFLSVPVYSWKTPLLPVILGPEDTACQGLY